MFRSQMNEFDELVAKATDENLTAENWELIMNVCDKVQENSSANGQEVVAAVIKRLSHRNANVQLYTIELANALVQNCDKNVHRELASRSFTDKILAMASDRTTHAQVKSRIQERMGEWAQEFQVNPDLGIMGQAYQALRSKNLHIPPPSRPQKTEISAADRRREEEELSIALALSMQDNPKPKPVAMNTQPQSQAQQRETPQARQPTQQQHQQSQQHQQQQQQQQQHNHQEQQPAEVSLAVPGSTPATVSRVRALYDFQPSEAGELQFAKGDIITVLESVFNDWWRGSLRGNVGIFPLNYVEKLADPSREELEVEAQMEAEVFGEMRNVEKLLALLSTNPGSHPGLQENEEISQLYHSTLSIRPKLIELIGKYSQKKEEFTQLNEKFIKARREYESLLEASMSHPPGGYGRSPYGGYGQPASQGPTHQSPYAPSQGPAIATAHTSHPAAFHILPADQQHLVPGQPQPHQRQQSVPPPQQQQQQPIPHSQIPDPAAGSSAPYSQPTHPSGSGQVDGGSGNPSPYAAAVAPGGSVPVTGASTNQLANTSSYDISSANVVPELASGSLRHSQHQPAYPPHSGGYPYAPPAQAAPAPFEGYYSPPQQTTQQPPQQKPAPQYAAYRPQSTGPTGYGGVSSPGGSHFTPPEPTYAAPPPPKPTTPGTSKVDEVELFYR